MDILARRAVLPTLFALALCAPVALAEDWAGWLYMDDGDVPLRAHVTGTPDDLDVVIDLPAAGQIGIRLGSARVLGDTLILAHPSEADPSIVLALVVGDGPNWPRDLAGQAQWSGVDGVVELHRADTPLVWEEPEEAAALVGVYSADDADAVVISQRFWGELLLVDAGTGAERTLFPQPDGGYVTGSALYVPAPVEARWEAERDADGAVTALVRHVGDERVRMPRREVEREELVIEREGVRLEGTLTVPGGAPAPCVVLAGGSNWRTRQQLDAQVQRLAALGLASVAYDKRGHGGSGGVDLAAFAVTGADLRAFADAARADERIDAARVGYLGSSRGGWYGALAAVDDPACAFFVSNVGPAVSPIAQETSARLDRMAEGDASPEERALAERYLRAMWTFTRTGEGGDDYLDLQARLEPSGWLDVLHGPTDLAPDSWAWMRLNGDHDQAAVLRRLACPTLALFGERDLAVAARINAPLMRDALWASRAEPAQVIVLPGCDHGLRPVRRDARGERLRYHRSTGAHPEVWSTIAAFVHGG